MRNTSIGALLVGIAALPASAGDAGAPAPAHVLTPVEKFFKGRILKVEGRSIELAYDFESPAQLDDFELSIPFRAIRTVTRTLENGQLRVAGTGTLRHKALFDKTSVGATATVVPVKCHDFGFAVTEEHESEVFTLYCLFDHYFSLGDGKDTRQNMIIKFIPRDPKANKDGQQDWRYCGSHGEKPEIERGKRYKVEIERGGNKSRFAIDDWETGGKEWDRDLLTQMVSLYVYESDFRCDDLVVRGVLEPEWLERNHVDLTTWKPPTPLTDAAGPAAPSEATTRGRAKIAGWPGETKPADMAALLRDASLPEAVRAEAASRAVEAGRKSLVPFLVDGLYAEDEPSQRFSYDALSKLAGKTFAFRSDAPEDQRKKAIQSINDYLKKHAAEFQ